MREQLPDDRTESPVTGAPWRIVLDTNVVLDLLHFRDPRLAPLAAAWAEGRVRPFADTATLAELERVVAYPKFAIGEAGRLAILDEYAARVLRCDAAGEEAYTLPRCRDPDDQKFLVLAARCRADLLVTRDRMLLRLATHRLLAPPCPIVGAEAAAKLLSG